MNTSILYVGLDIGKTSLQIHLANQNFPLPNTAPGHQKLIAQLKAQNQSLQVVCEATGGYEQALVAALHQAAIPVAIVEPARVRHFARACGLRSKTDRIDAALLTEFGRQTAPQPQCRRGSVFEYGGPPRIPRPGAAEGCRTPKPSAAWMVHAMSLPRNLNGWPWFMRILEVLLLYLAGAQA